MAQCEARAPGREEIPVQSWYPLRPPRQRGKESQAPRNPAPSALRNRLRQRLNGDRDAVSSLAHPGEARGPHCPLPAFLSFPVVLLAPRGSPEMCFAPVATAWRNDTGRRRGMGGKRGDRPQVGAQNRRHVYVVAFLPDSSLCTVLITYRTGLSRIIWDHRVIFVLCTGLLPSRIYRFAHYDIWGLHELIHHLMVYIDINAVGPHAQRLGRAYTSEQKLHF